MHHPPSARLQYALLKFQVCGRQGNILTYSDMQDPTSNSSGFFAQGTSFSHALHCTEG